MMDSLIDLENITRTFGTFTALNGVTLTLPPGRVGLLGPNGAGKSTLLKVLMGLIPPSSGTGRVLDQPLGGDRDGAANWQLRRLVGFMPEAHEVLSYLGLEEARYRRVEEYSAGMKQRAKLAQALVHDPPVLLLDEPTSGLDPAGRDAMLRLVRELGTDHGKSVILSTHLLADVQAVCERVVILAGGTVRGQGTVDELCARRGDRFKLRVQGDAGRFRDDLENEGVKLLADNGHGEWRVAVPDGWSNLAFFKLADLNDVVIRALVRDDETLEELFLRSVSG
jgi:ABC-2 type transport system ATP-binding protein